MANPSATVDIVTRSARFNRAMKGIVNTLSKVRRAMEGVSRIARRMLLVSAGVMTGLTVAFSTFEQKMARVKALAEATDDEFRRLTETANLLGATTRFTAREAATAMAAFALQGFKANDIIGAMPATLNLAAAGQVAVGQAARITAGIMRSMKLNVSELTRVVDVLAKATTSSATDVLNLGEAMRALGPVAKTSGLSVEETVAVLRAMADVMIQGGAAGTALRNILLRMQAGNRNVQSALKKLNVSVGDSSGKFRTFADIVEDVTSGLKGMGEISQTAALTQIAGLRAASAFTEVISLGADRIRQYTEELEGAAGASARIAAIELDTLQGSFILLASAVDAVAISFGKLIKPVLEPFVKIMTNIARRIKKWEDSTKNIVLVLGTALIAVSALTAGVAALVVLLESAALVATVLGPALAVAFSPVVIAGIIAMAAATTAMVVTMKDLNTELRITRVRLESLTTNVNDIVALLNLVRLQITQTSGNRKEQIRLITQAIALEKEFFKALVKELDMRHDLGGRTQEDAKELINTMALESRLSSQRITDLHKLLGLVQKVQEQPLKIPTYPFRHLLDSLKPAIKFINAMSKARKKGFDTEKARVAMLKIEAERIRESVKTTQDRLQEELQLLDVLRKRGEITDETFRRGRQLAIQEAKGDSTSIQGRLEGVTETFRRIQSAAAAGKKTNPLLQSSVKTQQLTQQSLGFEKTALGVLQWIRDYLRDAGPRAVANIGVFGV